MSEFHPVGFFDGLVVEVRPWPDLAEAQTAWKHFVALAAYDRAQASRHVYASYLDYHDSTEGVAFLDDQMGFPLTAESIWSHVHPRTITIEPGDASMPGRAYVVVEADCDWDEEQGLMLVFQDGKTLTKVSPYDGHLTNVAAFGNPHLDRVVYKAGSHDFITYRDDEAA